MLSQQLFFLLVALVALQRLLELWWSHRNEKALLASGGIRCAHEHFKWMKLIHASWLIAMVLEVWIFKRPFYPLLGGLSLFLFAIGQLVRITAIATLGQRWTASIMVLPGKKLVSHGLYRFIKHPNYVGVIVEIAFLPLVHSAILTSVIFSLLNLIILRIRIVHETQALKKYCIE
ncbi:MAG: Isoprenylcysteine carboxyl methyltransferase (ICMT) family protein [bacterium ADurb.BinA186]|nr:MAG: Isoprenylcysteine carboxyl methyltransferase (ICMT) family protein [bacterium ADurb.BinA186]